MKRFMFMLKEEQKWLYIAMWQIAQRYEDKIYAYKACSFRHGLLMCLVIRQEVCREGASSSELLDQRNQPSRYVMY